jgi:hypothetical protein
MDPGTSPSKRPKERRAVAPPARTGRILRPAPLATFRASLRKREPSPGKSPGRRDTSHAPHPGRWDTKSSGRPSSKGKYDLDLFKFAESS